MRGTERQEGLGSALSSPDPLSALLFHLSMKGSDEMLGYSIATNARFLDMGWGAAEHLGPQA